MTVVALILIATYAVFPRKYAKAVTEYSVVYGLDKDLVFALIKTESGFDPNSRSEKGATGLMQITPLTAEYISNRWFDGEEYDLYDCDDNLRYGCRYLAYLIEKFHGEKEALAAYNAGEGTVGEWLKYNEYSDDGISLKNIPYEETRSYVTKVLFRRKVYSIIYFSIK